MPKRPVSHAVPLLCLLSVVGAVLGSSCGDGSFDPTAQAEFLTPVAQAQEAGIRPYWLGQEFEADGVVLKIGGEASFYDVDREGPATTFRYGGFYEDRGGLLYLDTFHAAGGRADFRLEKLRSSRGAVRRGAHVAAWEGSLWSLPSATRPVNALVLFVNVDDMVVEAVAKAGTSGVPGDDWNPLIDEDLLIEVVAEHLRPYPE